MKRTMFRLLLLMSGLLTAACAPQITSPEALFDGGSDRLRPGLWALLSDDCGTPSNGAIFNWPSCAAPVRVRESDITVFLHLTPLQADFVLTEGAPPLLQLGISERNFLAGETTPEPHFGYFSFVSSGAEPFTSGELRILRCPQDDELPIAGLTVVRPDQDEEGMVGSTGGEVRCIAVTPDAVREAGRRALVRRPDYRAVWIAELP